METLTLNNPSDEDISIFIKKLSNGNIESLTIAEITVNAIHILAKALKDNTSLTKLDLNWNEIGDIGAQALAEVLKSNTSLTTLYLGNNEISDTGVQALAETLKSGNTSLKTLFLFSNDISPVGAEAIAEVLKVNTSLTELNLNSNQIGDDGAQVLAEALESNVSLTELLLFGNQISDKIPIENLLARNQTLKKSRETRTRSFFSAISDPSNSIYEGHRVYREIYRRLQKAIFQKDLLKS